MQRCAVELTKLLPALLIAAMCVGTFISYGRLILLFVYPD